MRPRRARSDIVKSENYFRNLKLALRGDRVFEKRKLLLRSLRTSWRTTPPRAFIPLSMSRSLASFPFLARYAFEDQTVSEAINKSLKIAQWHFVKFRTKVILFFKIKIYGIKRNYYYSQTTVIFFVLIFTFHVHAKYVLMINFFVTFQHATIFHTQTFH